MSVNLDSNCLVTHWRHQALTLLSLCGGEPGGGGGGVGARGDTLIFSSYVGSGSAYNVHHKKIS